MAIKTLGDVAAWYGVTKMTVQNWTKAGLPVEVQGGPGKSSQFDTEKVHHWRVEREIASRVTKTDDVVYDRAAEEARLKHHQANNEWLKEAETTGMIIPRDIVIDLCSAGASNVRAKMMSVRNGIQNEFPSLDDEVLEAIEEKHLQALEDLGNSGIPRGLRERLDRYTQDVSATAEADG